MKGGKSSAALLTDPDAVVDWGQVAMIITFIPNCPICLTEPTIAKATKCGHIFCWTCILQYLQNSYKCPICFQYVASEELKSVIGRDDPLYDKREMQFKLLKKNSVRNQQLLNLGINSACFKICKSL